MIKYAVFLFNLLGLFLYQLFFQANVTLTQLVPASANAGASFVVEATIAKPGVTGFAKFQEDLPKGFSAVAIDKQGATVLSSDNAIKFIWASLPSDNSFKVSFRITVDSSVASGTQTLAGKFLYVVNNEKQETDASSSIRINGSAPAPVANNNASANVAPAKDTTPAQTSVAANTPVSNVPSVPSNNTTVIPAATLPPPNPTISITRSYSSASVEPAGNVTVSLTVHKGGVSGFAKIEEDVPTGLIASAGDKQGASFTFVDNKVKFVWLSLPTDSVFTVSYKVAVSSNLSGNQSIGGTFSYLLNGNAISYIIATTSFLVNGTSQTIAATQPQTTQPAPTNEQTAVTNAPTAQPQTTQSAPANEQTTAANIPTTQPQTTQPAPANEQTAAATGEQPTNITPNIPSVSGMVSYRVQIMALYRPVKASALANMYNITVPIKEEMTGGFTKYTVGNFKKYKTVRNYRETIRNKGVKGPFVVAYNNGTRITVQEALMITRQQWYK